MFLLQRDPNTKSDDSCVSEPQITSEASSSAHRPVSSGSSSLELALQPPMTPTHPSLPPPTSAHHVPHTFNSLIKLTPEPDLLMPQTSAGPPPTVKRTATVLPAVPAPERTTSKNSNVIQPAGPVAAPSQPIKDTSQTVVEPRQDIVESHSHSQLAVHTLPPALIMSPSQVVSQPSPPVAAQHSLQAVTHPLSQAAVQPSQATARPTSQVATKDPRPAPKSLAAPTETNTLPNPIATPVNSQSLTNVESTSVPAPKVQYRVRNSAAPPSRNSSRRS